MREMCNFCDSFGRLNAEQGRRPWDHVLIESPNFVVVPTRGAIVEGWVLVVTKKHYLCMGALENELVSELNEVCGLACGALQECYGPAVMFENGPTKPKQLVGCGVDHAHLHVLPTTSSLMRGVQDIFRHPLEWMPAKGIQGTIELHEVGLPYLYLEQPMGKAYLATRPDFESQLFRRAIAADCGRPHSYDWKAFPEECNVRSTVNTLGAWLSSNGKNTLQ